MSETKTLKSFHDGLGEIEDKRQDLQFEKEALLRLFGWEIRCDLPGAFLLWCKSIQGERVCVDLDTAIRIESNLYFDDDGSEDS